MTLTNRTERNKNVDMSHACIGRFHPCNFQPYYPLATGMSSWCMHAHYDYMERVRLLSILIGLSWFTVFVSGTTGNNIDDFLVNIISRVRLRGEMSAWPFRGCGRIEPVSDLNFTLRRVLDINTENLNWTFYMFLI